MRRFWATLAASILLSGGAPAASAAPATVFAAASLQDVLTEAGRAYAKAGGPAPRFSFAGSQVLARQVEQGAPADLVVTADADWMDVLGGKGLVVPASRRDLVSNQLVLIAPAGSKARLALRPGVDLAAALGDGRLAVADVTSVPAGRYAKAALTALGAWDKLAGKLAPSDNVRGALAFVARGEAPLGIVYATDARAEPKVRVVAVFPEAGHPRIVYPAALIARSRNPEGAKFLGFLQGSAGAAIFRRYGFTVLPRPN